MKLFFKNLLSGKDNTTPDMGRWSWLGSHLAVTGGMIWNAMHGGAIDLVQLATAHSAVAGAHGVALFAKRHTEPDAEAPPA